MLSDTICLWHVNDILISGIFPCLQCELFFDRHISIYLVNTYIPSILSVMMSWISFWIDSGAVPARTTIGLLTVLTVTTQTTYVLSSLPRSVHIPAMVSTHSDQRQYTSLPKSVHIPAKVSTHPCQDQYTSLPRSVSAKISKHPCQGQYTSLSKSVNIPAKVSTHPCQGQYTSPSRSVHIPAKVSTHPYQGQYTSPSRSVHILVKVSTHPCQGQYKSFNVRSLPMLIPIYSQTSAKVSRQLISNYLGK